MQLVFAAAEWVPVNAMYELLNEEIALQCGRSMFDLAKRKKARKFGN